MALVSVYIPTKNRLDLLKRAVASVLSQTYSSVELVVADDGSTDGTRDYLSVMHREGKLKAVFLPASMGACVARNLAILQCTGEFVTGLDDDDQFMQERLSWFMEKWTELQRSGVRFGALFDSVREIRPHGETIRRTRTYVSAAELRLEGLVGNQVFSTKENYVGAGLFDPAMPIWQDWDLWVRIGKRYGDFFGLNSRSYMIDATHDFNRITRKPAFMVRHAVEMYFHKHGPFTPKQKARILASMAGYPQVKLSATELTALITGGEGLSLAKYLTRRILGEEKYERYKFGMVINSELKRVRRFTSA